jgi:hypothetical protein
MQLSNMKYSAAVGILSSTVGDTLFLLEPDNGVYYELNMCGSHLWNKLQNKSLTFEECCKSLTEHFEGEGIENIRTEVEDFIDSLSSKKLITTVDH